MVQLKVRKFFYLDYNDWHYFIYIYILSIVLFLGHYGQYSQIAFIDKSAFKHTVSFVTETVCLNKALLSIKVIWKYWPM